MKVSVTNYDAQWAIDGAQQYGDLKRKLVQQHPEDMEAYIQGKDAFVKGLEKKALDCYSKAFERGMLK